MTTKEKEKYFLIGDEADFVNFKRNTNNIDFLPIRNLPMSYFPFYYKNSETSIEKMNRLVPLIKNSISDANSEKQTAVNDIDTEKLFILLTNLEEPYQPFNNNLIFHIKLLISIVWILIVFGVLRIIAHFLNENYTYFISIMIILMLAMATIWALVITSKNF